MHDGVIDVPKPLEFQHLEEPGSRSIHSSQRIVVHDVVYLQQVSVQGFVEAGCKHVTDGFDESRQEGVALPFRSVDELQNDVTLRTQQRRSGDTPTRGIALRLGSLNPGGPFLDGSVVDALGVTHA